jgi:hypothetical protein
LCAEFLASDRFHGLVWQACERLVRHHGHTRRTCTHMLHAWTLPRAANSASRPLDDDPQRARSISVLPSAQAGRAASHRPGYWIVFATSGFGHQIGASRASLQLHPCRTLVTPIFSHQSLRECCNDRAGVMSWCLRLTAGSVAWLSEEAAVDLGCVVGRRFKATLCHELAALVGSYKEQQMRRSAARGRTRSWPT